MTLMIVSYITNQSVLLFVSFVLLISVNLSTTKNSKRILRLSEGSIQQLKDVKIQFAEFVAP